MSKIFKSFMSMVITAILLASLTAIASAQTPPGYVHEEEILVYNCNLKVPNPLLFPPYLFDSNEDISITIEADVPAQVAPGEEFDIHNAKATVRVPANVVQTLRGILGWNSIQGVVSKFEVHSVNQTNTIDVASTPIPIPATPVPTTGDLEFTVPDSGLTVGKFTAGQSGVVTLKGGNINATFEKEGGSTLKILADCTPPANNNLVDIPIIP